MVLKNRNGLTNCWSAKARLGFFPPKPVSDERSTQNNQTREKSRMVGQAVMEEVGNWLTFRTEVFSIPIALVPRLGEASGNHNATGRSHEEHEEED